MNFLYEAVDASGETTLGKIEATDATEAQRRLVQSGYRPLSIAPTTNSALTETPLPIRTPYDTPAQLQSQSQSQRSTVIQAQPRMTSAPMQVNQNTAMARQMLSQSSTGTASGMILSGNAAKTSTKTRAKTTLTTAPSTSGALPAVANASKLGGANSRDLMLFFQQLASLVKSGMTINSALDNLGPRTRNANISQTAREMANAAKTGGKVSDVMAQYPRIYPDHVVGMVRAGELGGFLEIALAEIAFTYEQNIALYKGAWLPKFLALQALFALPLGLPLMSSVFKVRPGGDLDLKANIHDYLIQAAIQFALCGILYFLVVLGARRLQLPQFRHFRDSLSLKMPPFGALQRQAALANFVRMLRRLYQAGVSPTQAWEGAMWTASNVVIREKLAGSYDMMQKGASFADAFTATGLFHDSIEQLLVTGQASGQMPEMLDQAAGYYQQQMEESASKVKRAIFLWGVRAMLVFGGILICWVAYSYFHGIFNFVDNFMKPAGGGDE